MGVSLPLELLNHILRYLWTLGLCAHGTIYTIYYIYRHFQDQRTATPDFAASYESIDQIVWMQYCIQIQIQLPNRCPL